ncbi:G-box-binding factor 4-like [Coffea arabica]|uniref:G-box-binding factor 4-like n=1 Tax=Coffea arabica TaxID=13443 RepID=A0A6P6UYR7_COFAR|nr:G-box-binding factor 4-like isoform X2 [Coffea arabica]
MATSKLMASSTSAATSSHNSELRRNSLSKSDFHNFRNHHHYHQNSPNAAAAVSASTTTTESTLLNAEITLLDASGAITPISPAPVRKKTVDDVWREIVAGKTAASEPARRVEPKEEAMDEMMTLEDFLVKAGAVEESAVAAAAGVEGEVKVEAAAVAGTSGGMFAFDSPYMSRQGSVESGGGLGYASAGGLETMGSGGLGGGGGRGKRRASSLLEPMDKAAQQRQRRMIKNRESAARSRERKQAYQVELEAMAVRLEEENEQLLKEKAERTKERCKLLKEKVIPVVEKRRPARILRRVRSMEW